MFGDIPDWMATWADWNSPWDAKTTRSRASYHQLTATALNTSKMQLMNADAAKESVSVPSRRLLHSIELTRHALPADGRLLSKMGTRLLAARDADAQHAATDSAYFPTPCLLREEGSCDLGRFHNAHMLQHPS